MPNLDVSNIILDPMFCDTCSVTRRRQVVGNDGIGSTDNTIFPNVKGVFTVAGPNDLQRLPEEQHMNQNFSFVTKFRLYGPAKDSVPQDYQPDIITWAGNTYVVSDVGPYTRYGAGFVQAIITSNQAIDVPDV